MFAAEARAKSNKTDQHISTIFEIVDEYAEMGETQITYTIPTFDAKPVCKKLESFGYQISSRKIKNIPTITQIQVSWS